MLKVIIPAFPRSGTSFLSGLIVRLGFSPGPPEWMVKPDMHNPFGYYECLPLLKISRQILAKFGGDFLKNIPHLPPGWLDEVIKEQQQILDLVQRGNIEVFKDGPMLIIADLYHRLFPEAKWIVIHRDIHETYRSRFGKPLTFEEWQTVTGTRMDRWRGTQPYSKALQLDYDDFSNHWDRTVRRICAHLEIEPDQSRLDECREFFAPGQRLKLLNGNNEK